MIVLHPPQRFKVNQSRANHAGNSSDRFKHNGPVTISLCKKAVGEEPQQFGDSKCKAVTCTAGTAVPWGVRCIC